MKKALMILLALLLLVALLPGMAAAEEKTPEEYGFKTLKDAFAYEFLASGSTGELYIYVFAAEGAYYRVDADIPAQVNEQMGALDVFDAAYKEKEQAIIGDLPVKKVYALSEVLLSQEDLNALGGKTGQELTDMGFVPQGSFQFADDGVTFYLVKGPFEYEVHFAEVLPAQDNPNIVEVMAPLTVQSASFIGVSSYVLTPVFDLNGSPVWEYTETPEPVTYPIAQIPLEDSPFKTIGDVLAIKGGQASASLSNGLYVVAFNQKDAYYRAEAELPEEIFKQIRSLKRDDSKRMQKMNDLLAPLPITRIGDLSAAMPSAEELGALKGLTGQELLDRGFTYGSGYSFSEEPEMYLEKGLFEYHFCFSGTVPKAEDYDDILDEIMPALTVEEAEFYGLTDLCADPDLLW